jgi:hypothetical protein
MSYTIRLALTNSLLTRDGGEAFDRVDNVVAP